MTTLEDSNLVAHARRELDRVGLGDSDVDYGGMLKPALLDLVATFAAQGHSGMSAAYTIGLLEKLLRYEPLAPLTGDNDEWHDVSDVSGYPLWQNIRSSRVFKRGDGTAFDVVGRVFEDRDGDRYFSGDSHTEVTFPYVPTTAVVKRDLT